MCIYIYMYIYIYIESVQFLQIIHLMGIFWLITIGLEGLRQDIFINDGSGRVGLSLLWVGSRVRNNGHTRYSCVAFVYL